MRATEIGRREPAFGERPVGRTGSASESNRPFANEPGESVSVPMLPDPPAGSTASPLPPIPVLGDGGLDPAALAARYPERIAAVLREARRHYTTAALWLGDRVSRAWAEAVGVAYLDEMRAVADQIGAPGAWLLNLSYEWGCTTACRLPAAGDPAGSGPLLYHTLDWQLTGLGETVLVVRRSGRAGAWWAIGWAGFVGVVQALAPGRFAACLNQAPEPASGFGRIGDWIRGRHMAWTSRALPPALLLRRAFDTCSSFAEACACLASTPVCLPVIYAVTGPEPSDAAVIERLPQDARVHRPGEARALSVTNHWLNGDFPGVPRSYATHARLVDMRAWLERSGGRADPEPGSWLQPPIRNARTRLAMEMDAASGDLWLQGWGRDRPVTQPLKIRLRSHSALQIESKALQS